MVEELAARMVQLGHQVTCYNRRGHHVSGADFDGERQGEHRGIRLKWVPTVDKKGLAAVTSSFYATLQAAFSDADVVHIHAEGPAYLCWLPRLMGKRVVVTVHGLDWQRDKWKHGLGAAFIRMGERMAVRWAHRIIVLSRNVQRYFQDTYGRDTDYIPNGVTAPRRIGPEILAGLGLEKDGYVLFLGRLVPEKCPHLLIRAYRQLNTDKKLVIAGSSSDTDAYAAQLKDLAGDETNIVFTGFVQGQLLEALYSNAWVYVLPSGQGRFSSTAGLSRSSSGRGSSGDSSGMAGVSGSAGVSGRGCWGLSSSSVGMHSTSPTISRAGLMSLLASSRSRRGIPNRLAIR